MTPQIGRRVALDLGSVRIGLAATDAIGSVASPRKVVSRSEVVGELRELLPIARLYVGLPRHLSGVEGEAAKLAREFALELKSELSLATFLVDERLTTKSASELRRANPALANVGIDALAAYELLEFALAGERLQGGEFGEPV